MKISRRGWLQKVSLLASSLLFNPSLVFAKKQDAEKAIDLIVYCSLFKSLLWIFCLNP